MAPLSVSGQAPLTLRQAIDQALGHSPQASMARAGEQEAKSESTIVRSQLLPQFSFTEDISRGDDAVYAFGTRLRQGQFTQADFALNALNRPQPIGNFSSRFSGSWTAFDSFKTKQELHRADLLRAGSTFSSVGADQQIVLNVVRSYQSVLYAQREIDVARHVQETAAALLASVDERVKAGLAVESDRMSAQVNVAARTEQLIAAQGDLELAWADLREAMGAPDLKAVELDPIEPHTFPPLPLEDEITAAIKSRPDLMAVEQGQMAQASSVAAARSSLGPTVSTYGNWEEDRASLGSAGGHSWVAGVQITVDLLPAGKRAQLAREVAAKRRVDAQLSAARQSVQLQVSRAHIHEKTAALSVDTARAAMDQAAESLRIVRNRYDAGLATITDLLRAGDAERQSQSTYWHAVYGNATSYAELLYAIGKLTPDAAEGLQ